MPSLYRTLLGEAARHHGCAVHAYVLMTNHVHVLLTPRAGGSVSRLMQWLGTRYVRHVNTAHRNRPARAHCRCAGIVHPRRKRSRHSSGRPVSDPRRCFAGPRTLPAQKEWPSEA